MTDQHPNPMSQPPPSVPSPDPTSLTTELVRTAIDAFREVMTARLDGMDKATDVLAQRVSLVPAELRESRDAALLDVQHSVEALHVLLDAVLKADREVTIERFRGVDHRFVERDTRIDQAAQESRISLAAALAAQKEAVAEQNKANTLATDKSEAAGEKRSDAMVQLMAANYKTVDDKIGDLQRRLDLGEGARGGVRTQKTDTNILITTLIAVAGLGVAAVSVAIVMSR